MVWSWKKVSCSIKGDALSWRPRYPHVAIRFVLKRNSISQRSPKPIASNLLFYRLEIKGISLYLWSPGGYMWAHSIEVGIYKDEITTRWETILSQIMIINPRTATNEIIDPKEDKTFQTE